MATLAGFVRTGRQVAAEFSEKNVTFMAAGIAYNAFVSLAPLLLLLLFVVSAVGGGLEEWIVAIARGSLPGPIADVVATVFEGGSTAPGASVVVLVVLLWGTLKIFRGLDTAFSEIYETTRRNSLLDQVIDGLVAFGAVIVAIVATVGVTAAFATFADAIPFVGVLTTVVLVVGLVVAFLPLYYRFPDADVDWNHVLPGVVFAAVGWAAFQALFQAYLSLTGGGPGQFFGGVLVVVTWLYVSGLVLLLGAVINAVLGGHASGEAGGVGRGATGYETIREETLPCEAFDAYLAALRDRIDENGELRPPTDVHGDDGKLRPPADGTDGRPGTRDGVTVIEQSRSDGDGREWAVSFRWRTAADDPGRSTGSANGPDAGAGSADDDVPVTSTRASRR